jgi:hypothetical protein
MLRFFSATKFIKYREYKMNDNEIMISTTNFTIINTVLCWCGPLHEETLTYILLLLQVNYYLINHLFYFENISYFRLYLVVYLHFSFVIIL